MVVGGAAAECIVVSVVVRDRTEGAGEEKVLSAPRPEIPHPIVTFVPSPDDGACDGAASECAFPGSVETVPAVDLFPMVGGGSPSSEDRIDSLLGPTEGESIDVPVGTVEKERLLFAEPVFPFR